MFERTRELGLLRAVGMSRRQLRRMVRYEAAVVATFGATLGVNLGLLFGFGVVTVLPASIASGFAIPISQIAIVMLVVVAAAAGGWRRPGYRHAEPAASTSSPRSPTDPIAARAEDPAVPDASAERSSPRLSGRVARTLPTRLAAPVNDEGPGR